MTDSTSISRELATAGTPNAEVFNNVMAGTRQLSDLLACAFHTMRKEMIDAGAPHDLALDAAKAHVRKILADMVNPSKGSGDD